MTEGDTVMSEKATLVLRGFYNLTPSEQQDVLDEIEKYRKADYIKRTSYKQDNERDFNNIILGPIGTGCGFCGK